MSDQFSKEKNFHRFFDLFSPQNHSIRKIKIFEKKIFFEKIQNFEWSNFIFKWSRPFRTIKLGNCVPLIMFSLDTKFQNNILSRFQDILLQISKNSHFELYYWMILKLQKFAIIRHFNIFTCGFRQKFTNLPNFHFINDFSQYLSSLFVKVQKTPYFCDFWMIRNF